jgi:hypothetical protein
LSKLPTAKEQGTGKPAAVNQAANPPTAPKLTERQECMLVVMLNMKAVGNSQKINRSDVVDRIDKRKIASDFARDFGALKRKGFTDSEAGPEGGVWLTDEGKRKAEEVKRKSH